LTKCRAGLCVKNAGTIKSRPSMILKTVRQVSTGPSPGSEADKGEKSGARRTGGVSREGLILKEGAERF